MSPQRHITLRLHAVIMPLLGELKGLIIEV